MEFRLLSAQIPDTKQPKILDAGLKPVAMPSGRFMLRDRRSSTLNRVRAGRNTHMKSLLSRLEERRREHPGHTPGCRPSRSLHPAVRAPYSLLTTWGRRDPIRNPRGRPLHAAVTSTSSTAIWMAAESSTSTASSFKEACPTRWGRGAGFRSRSAPGAIDTTSPATSASWTSLGIASINCGSAFP